MTAWHKNVSGQTSHGYPPQGNQASLLSMKKIKMLTKANFRVPTRLLETIQSCGHNPLRTGIAVTTQGSLEDKTFKAMTTENKETVNSGLFFFALYILVLFLSLICLLSRTEIRHRRSLLYKSNDKSPQCWRTARWRRSYVDCQDTRWDLEREEKESNRKKRIERENTSHSGSTVCLHPDWLQPVEGPITARTQSLIHRTGFADVTSCFLF